MKFEELRDLIVETLGCDADQVTPEASLTADLKADSLSLVELVRRWRRLRAFPLTMVIWPA